MPELKMPNPTKIAITARTPLAAPQRAYRSIESSLGRDNGLNGPANGVRRVGRDRVCSHNPGMRAMLLERQGELLRAADLPAPEPGAGQVLVRVRACGVCRTDLHVVDGDLADP